MCRGSNVRAEGLVHRDHIEVTDAPAPGAALEPEQEEQLLEGLLTNVYRAFDLREEEAVYDKLALTVAGDLLEETPIDPFSAPSE